MRALLVGLDNSRKEMPHRALWPLPEGSVGNRLMKLIDNQIPEDYRPGAFALDFHRTNLYPARRAPNGRGQAAQDNDAMAHVIAHAIALKVNDVVLVGNRVRQAFNGAMRESRIQWTTTHLDWLHSCVVEAENTMVRFWAVPYPDRRYAQFREHEQAMGQLLERLRGRRAIPWRDKTLDGYEESMRQ